MKQIPTIPPNEAETPCGDFGALTPDALLEAVEAAIGRRLAGFAHPHTSYINRVYELQPTGGERIIAKFYRPGRWTREAILQEHEFVLECAAEEIPVVPPDRLTDGGTLGNADGIPFAVFEKRRGREFEPVCDEDWRRLGRIAGRMQAVGARKPAPARLTMHPAHSTAADIDYLRRSGTVPARWTNEFFDAADRILEGIEPLFEDVELTRIHGDCHCRNILERPDTGLMLIDFDDMVNGPAVQDLWMLLPEHARDSRREIFLILEGYEVFREFDDFQLKLIEPLRVMRMLYFLAWCARQIDDPNFARKYPEWGSEAFWRKEVADLERQRGVIESHL